jgi:hypothetical protein
MSNLTMAYLAIGAFAVGLYVYAERVLLKKSWAHIFLLKRDK